MSYDISLLEPGTDDVIEFDEPHQIRGGTHEIGGTTQAWLNVTYNYAKHFVKMGDEGIRTIYGMTGEESIPILEKAISGLKDDAVPINYWKPTEGNAKEALKGLLVFAKARPDGIWAGD